MKNILVTGANGFIGKYLSSKLIKEKKLLNWKPKWTFEKDIKDSYGNK